MNAIDRMETRRQRSPRRDAATQTRVQREARQAFDQAARMMRRKVRAVVTLFPIPEHADQAARVLEASSVFLTRAELVQMARECAAEFCSPA